jgi:hypothetical protein
LQPRLQGGVIGWRNFQYKNPHGLGDRFIGVCLFVGYGAE